MKDHGLWNERYRPQNLDTFVGNEQLKQTLQHFINQNDIQNLLLYGGAGCGKTTLAKLLTQNLDCESLIINASDERGIETIRDKVMGFASVASFKPLKLVILDESDFLTIQAQASLRNIIETFSRNTRFILTCNFVERIIDPIQSRCQVLKVIPPSKKEVAKHLSNILTQEKVKFNIKYLVPLINQYYPDLRKCINTLQLFTNKDNILILDPSLLISASYIDKIIDELKQDKTDFKTLRQILIDSNLDDFNELFRALFDRSSEYMPGKEGTLAILINEHQYKANFRIDKEINMSSLLQQIINNK